MIFAAFFGLVLVASTPVPTFFDPPKGWIAKTPPPDAPVDFIWLSPSFGKNGNGEKLSIMSQDVAPGTTLASEVHDATDQLSQDRIIAASHAERTCHGLQAGWAFDARLPLPNGKTISQVYHLTILGNRSYSFIFTHSAKDRIEQAVRSSIESICPSGEHS
jgi:hypothetical protein